MKKYIPMFVKVLWIYGNHYNKKLNKDKYHTFLVFYSGSVILSSSGPDTEEVYNQFMKIIQENKHVFNDTTKYDEKVELVKSDMMFV